MNTIILVLLGIIALIYAWYASIVKKRNKALEALSSIDVYLKQRFDLLPNILVIAQKYMQHERGLLEEVTALRAHANQNYDPKNSAEVTDHLAAAQNLAAKFGQLMVAVENYPDLKANQTMIEAMNTNNEVESHIAAARRFYNASVTVLNNSIQIFPGNYIAKLAGVTTMPFYEADLASKETIKASQFLS